MKNRSENLAGRGQILPVLQGNSYSIAQKSGEIWTGQANLQPVSFKLDRLLAHGYKAFILVLIALAGVQTGCGFHPRGEISLPNFITPIFVDLSASDDPLGRELMILLSASGANNLAGSAGEAETILTVSNVRRRQRLAAVDDQGRAREYELNYQFQYELKKASASDVGAEIIKTNEIKLKSNLLFDPDNVLATGHEENALYAEMRKTAARLLFRQLSASRPSEARPVLPQQ